MINSRGSRDAGDRVVVRHGTEVILVREREWAQNWGQKCCGKISLRWHRGWFKGGTGKGGGAWKRLGTAWAQVMSWN